MLINKNEKSVVEGYFDVSRNDVFRRALADAELDFDAQSGCRKPRLVQITIVDIDRQHPVGAALLHLDGIEPAVTAHVEHGSAG